MTMKRKPVAFGDLRGWIDALRAQGELHEINAQVDWNIELGTIMRLAQGPGTGPALLFNNIKDYNLPTSRCRRIFGSALNNNRRIAMMLGLPPDTHARELVKIGRNILTETIAPKTVKSGPVKENIVTAKDVNLDEFPTPYWNRLDGGRYLITYAGVVTRDPDTGIMNVGIYRGMIGDQNKISDADVACPAYRPARHGSAGAWHEGIADRGRYRLEPSLGCLRRVAGAPKAFANMTSWAPFGRAGRTREMRKPMTSLFRRLPRSSSRAGSGLIPRPI